MKGLSPGASARRKGYAFERECVEFFRLLLPEAEVHRVPLSGAGEGFKGDLRVVLKGEVFFVEAKRRKRISKMFKTDSINVIREDRGEIFLLIPSSVLIRFLGAVRQ